MNASARRFEIGPVLLVLGALLLIASLFVDWFEPGLTAWNAFEWLDLLLAAIALMVIIAAVGLLLPGRALIDADFLPLLVAVPLAIVAVQLLDPPPFAAGGEPETGAWLALGACLLMGAGAVLSFGRMHLSVSFEGRDPRQRVSAVDARGTAAGSPGSGSGSEGTAGPPDPGARRGRSPGEPASPAAGPDAAARGAVAAAPPGRSRPGDRPAWSPRAERAGRLPGAAASGGVDQAAAGAGSEQPPSGWESARASGAGGGTPPGGTPVVASGAGAATHLGAESAGGSGAVMPPGADHADAGNPAQAAPGGVEAGNLPPGADAAGASASASESPETEVQPAAGAPAPAPPAGESPRRSGGLFGSWFDEPSRGGDDAADGPGGTRPAGS